MKAECDDLVAHIRRFLSSVLGPLGDAETPPSKSMKVDYIFYGANQLETRCKDFFDDMVDCFKVHKAWKEEPDERLYSARDRLEQYVFSRIGNFAFNLVHIEEADDSLLRRMQILAFIQPEVCANSKFIYYESFNWLKLL